MKQTAMLALFVLCSFLPGWLGSQSRPGEWYAALAKPAFNPPSWIFAPVWTALYLMMGIAAWLVWRRAGFRDGGPALAVFAVQLILNGLWSWIFFGQHRIGAALVDIVLLWAAILACLALFWRRQPAAGALLLPYLVWVSFAAVLNAALWRLNR
jgi:translocator protein